MPIQTGINQRLSGSGVCDQLSMDLNRDEKRAVFHLYLRTQDLLPTGVPDEYVSERALAYLPGTYYLRLLRKLSTVKEAVRTI